MLNTVLDNPTLSDVISSRSEGEWITLKIQSFSIIDSIDTECGQDHVIKFDMSLSCTSSESIRYKYNTHDVIVEVTVVDDIKIQNLEGDYPIGHVDLNEEKHPIFYISVTKDCLKRLTAFLSSDPHNVNFRIKIPVSESINKKVLPIICCKIYYQ